ncbi:MAG: molecular chaperone DnaJ [Alphaproteobacteria bacterium]|nr:molecular chaperone DnaJ [Alphaproteobacteria bacterium]
MAKSDFYETLGVNKDASPDELKKAYRKQAMKFHPDRNADNADAERKFKEVNEAYDVLKDEQKRAAYDRFGHSAFEGGMGGGGGAGMGAGGFDFGGSSFSDIFEDLFGGAGGGMGGGRRANANTRGADLRYNLGIDLEDAFKGAQKTITITTSVACSSCEGSGGESGSKPTTCPTCSGAGKIRAQQGFFTVERTCQTCHGMGKVIKDPCKKCAGSGRMRKDKSLVVNIPAGVEEGTRIRLAGEGEAGFRGGPEGDLYIFLSIKPHELFKRDGANIHCKVPLSFTSAALGGTVEVPTIDGSRVKVNIPSGTQNGRQFRLKGRGMSIMRSQSRGDMYIHANVETPVNLSKRQKEILRDFEKSSEGKSNSPESEGFFSKVKDFWEDLKE